MLKKYICRLLFISLFTTISLLFHDAALSGTGKDGKDESCILIDDLEIKGNEAFSSLRLKMRMKTWHSTVIPGLKNCFNREWLQKDIKSLLDLYRAKDYPDADIRYELQCPSSDIPYSNIPSSDTPSSDTPSSDTPSSDTPSSDTPSSDIPSSNIKASSDPCSIYINISEGVQYELVFHGNTFF
ncbi:MAG: hypothetical protein HQK66_10400, partial [Desulfamplus sp.]|nr:hypothetical protein [Desulfamplus sp.]